MNDELHADGNAATGTAGPRAALRRLLLPLAVVAGVVLGAVGSAAAGGNPPAAQPNASASTEPHQRLGRGQRRLGSLGSLGPWRVGRAVGRSALRSPVR